MDNRKEIILNTIIKEHIKTGQPVSSSCLVDKYKLNISSATVRNEMAELEEGGFIVQPHTSAGRIPTEKAYNFFIENLKEKKGDLKDKDVFKNILKNKEEQNLKLAAKEIARISQLAIFWAFHKNNLYYTGISNLLQQPEFIQNNLVYDISLIIDKMEEIIDDVFDELDYGPQVLVGSKNPFSNFCGSIVSKYKVDGKVGMFGILGPMRMDYEKNLALINFVNNKIKEK